MKRIVYTSLIALIGFANNLNAQEGTFVNTNEDRKVNEIVQLNDPDDFMSARFTAARDAIAEPELYLFPNPARNYANIILPKMADNYIQVMLFDMNGNILNSAVYSPGGNQISIDLAHVPQGFYNIRVQEYGYAPLNVMLNKQ